MQNHTQLSRKAPTEIWDQIRAYLPSLSTYALDRVLGRPEDRYHRVWSSVFKNESFLDEAMKNGVSPVLIGHDLHQLFSSRDLKSRHCDPRYLVLVLAHNGHGSNTKPWSCDWNFLENSLQTSWKSGSAERYFPDISTTVNFRDAVNDGEFTWVTQPKQLTSRKIGGLNSAYLYWNDPKYKIRIINPGDVKGIGRSLMGKDVSRIVALSWVHLPSEKKRQHFFAISGDTIQRLKVIVDHKAEVPIQGWEWKNSLSLEDQ